MADFVCAVGAGMYFVWLVADRGQQLTAILIGPLHPSSLGPVADLIKLVSFIWILQSSTKSIKKFILHVLTPVLYYSIYSKNCKW